MSTGVRYHKQMKRWHAVLHWQGDRLHVGYFDDENDAIAARTAAKNELETLSGEKQGSRVTKLDRILHKLRQGVEDGTIPLPTEILEGGEGPSRSREDPQEYIFNVEGDEDAEDEEAEQTAALDEVSRKRIEGVRDDA